MYAFEIPTFGAQLFYYKLSIHSKNSLIYGSLIRPNFAVDFKHNENVLQSTMSTEDNAYYNYNRFCIFSRNRKGSFGTDL